MRRKILYSILNEWRDEDMDDSPIDIDDDLQPTSSDMSDEPNLDDDEFALSTINNTHSDLNGCVCYYDNNNDFTYIFSRNIYDIDPLTLNFEEPFNKRKHNLLLKSWKDMGDYIISSQDIFKKSEDEIRQIIKDSLEKYGICNKSVFDERFVIYMLYDKGYTRYKSIIKNVSYDTLIFEVAIKLEYLEKIIPAFVFDYIVEDPFTSITIPGSYDIRHFMKNLNTSNKNNYFLYDDANGHVKIPTLETDDEFMKFGYRLFYTKDAFRIKDNLILSLIFSKDKEIGMYKGFSLVAPLIISSFFEDSNMINAWNIDDLHTYIYGDMSKVNNFLKKMQNNFSNGVPLFWNQCIDGNIDEIKKQKYNL